MRHLVIARSRWLTEAFDIAGGSAAFAPVVVRRRCVFSVLPVMSAVRGSSNVALIACSIPIVRHRGEQRAKRGDRLARLTRRSDADFATSTTASTTIIAAAGATTAVATASVATVAVVVSVSVWS